MLQGFQIIITTMHPLQHYFQGGNTTQVKQNLTSSYSNAPKCIKALLIIHSTPMTSTRALELRSLRTSRWMSLYEL